MKLLFDHVWVLFILVTVVNGLALKKRSRAYIAADPELKPGYEKLIKGWMIYGNIPWVVMAIGVLSGTTNGMLEYFVTGSRNPGVIAFYLSVVVMWILGTYWLFFRGGAELLVRHPGLIRMRGFGVNKDVTSATVIKITWGICVLGGSIGMVLWGHRIMKDPQLIKIETWEKRINEAGADSVSCEPYFDFDNVDHYSIKGKEEEELWRIGKKKNISDAEKKQVGLLLDEPLTGTISDTVLLEGIELAGFTKANIPSDKLKKLKGIFCERKHEIVQAKACKAVYRDILVFKKDDRTVGLAKICFHCDLSAIIGTSRNTEEFGQSGDYEKLEEILRGQ